MKSIFDRHHKEYDAWYDRNKFAYLSEVEVLKKLIHKDERGLEIGVGTGRFASALGVTMGIDPSHAMLAKAAERGVNVRWGFGENLPFWEESFDYILIVIALCFVREPGKVLREAHRVLKPDGKILIGIIDKTSFLGKFYRRKRSPFYSQARFFSTDEVREMLEENRFKNLSYWQTLFRLPDEINFIEKPQRGFGKGGFVVVCAKKPAINSKQTGPAIPLL